MHVCEYVCNTMYAHVCVCVRVTCMLAGLRVMAICRNMCACRCVHVYVCVYAPACVRL